MAGIKSLAKDTAIYGTSSIVVRFMNWCLTPLYTYKLPAGEFGVSTNLYAWVSLLLVVLTYGLETGFFRFANDPKKGDSKMIYSTCLTSLGSTSLLFIGLVLLFLSPVAELLKCTAHHDYIVMMAFIIAMDAFSALPFAYLRYQRRPIRFATLKALFIAINICANIFFLLLCPWIWKQHPEWISWFYHPGYGVGYIFISNLIASFIILLMLMPEIIRIPFCFNKTLLKEILRYSFPLLILGLAGIMNQNLDKILFPFLMDNPTTAMNELGIYGANNKIAIVMLMFTQAFRYAYEPFIFAQNKDENKQVAYAKAMKFFIIFGLLIFLGVMFYLEILRYFISPDYFSGLKIVPIVMLADLFFGVFFNLSLWYKLTDKTLWGIYFSFFGLAIILAINIIFVPLYGYIACAWAAFICYAAMMLFSYFIGQHYYPIKYDLKGIGVYFLLAMTLYAISSVVLVENTVLRLLFRSLLLAIFIIYIIKKDIPLSDIPVINRWIKC